MSYAKVLHKIILIGVLTVCLGLWACGMKRLEVKSPEGEGMVNVSVDEGVATVKITPPPGEQFVNFSSSKLDAPNRIVIDVVGNNLAGFPYRKDVGEAMINSITFSRVDLGGGATGKIEIFLSQESEYKADLVQGALEVRIQSAGEVYEEKLEEDLLQIVQEITEESASEMEEPVVAAETTLPVIPERPAGDGVTAVTVASEDDTSRVNIYTNGSVAAYKTIDLSADENPRLVVDLMDFSNKTGFSSKDVGYAQINRIRMGTHPDKTRIVLDLSVPNVHIYDVKENADGLTFYIASQPIKMAAEPEVTEVAAAEAPIPIPEEEAIPEAEPTPVAMAMMPAAEEAAVEAPMEVAQAEAEPVPMAVPEEEIPPAEEPALVEQPMEEEMPAAAEAPVEEYPPLEILPPGEEIPTTAVAPAPAAPARPVTVEGIDFKQLEGKSRVVVTTSAPATYDVASGPGAMVTVTISKASLLPRLKRILDTSEFDSPVVKITPVAEGRQVTASVYLREMVPYVASQDGNAINIDFSRTKVFKEPTPPPTMVKLEQGVVEEMAPVAEEAPVMEPIPPAPTEEVEEIPPTPVVKKPAAPPTAPSLIPVASARVPVVTQVPSEEYTGQKISLDFQDADIHNILRLIADISNVNIIAGDDVKGRVTLKLKDVPWDQALEIILETNGLGVLKKGNIYRIAKRDKILAEKKAMIAVEDTHTIMIPLNYATAQDVAAKIKGLGLLSERGNVKVDERTNRIIVTDVRGNLENIRKLVLDLDLPIPQVLIEARIVEVNSNYARELGIQWGGQYTADSAHGNSLPYDFPNSMTVAGDAGGSYAINLPAAAGQGSGGALAFTFGHIADTLTLDLRLSALENLNEGRVISSPRVTTLNKKKAVIAQGAEIPYSTRTAEGTDVAFKKAELSLQVTPYVNANNSIILKIKVNKDAPDETLQSFEGVPGLATKSATTEVLVNDGDTTVIGGIYTSDQSNNQQGIPVLSNIPILGYMFRFQGKSTSKQELLIFITPRVIHNEIIEREPIDLGVTNSAATN